MPLNIHDYDDVTLDEIANYPGWLQEEIDKSMRDSMPQSRPGVMNIFEFTDQLLERWRSSGDEDKAICWGMNR
jgi:hypothetical protein